MQAPKLTAVDHHLIKDQQHNAGQGTFINNNSGINKSINQYY
jgi:hypothetical protein